MRNTTKMREDDIKNKKPNKKLKTILLVVASVVLVCLAVTFIYVESKLSVMNQKIVIGTATMPPDTEAPAPTSIPEINQDELGQIQNLGNQTPSPDNLFSNPKVINILLLGIDTRDPKQFTGSRSDTILIVTLDTINKEVKLTSIMRDTLVSIPGHDLNRINTVFGYSGPDAAAATIQKYFGVKIDYYAVMNFWAVANVIDIVGGVNINVKADEIANLNKNLDEINKYNLDKDSPHVRKSGMQKLDGKQAVAYMRIRHVGEADFERTQRQRSVLEDIMKKNLSLPEILSIASKLPNNIRTDIGQVELASLASTAFDLKGTSISQLRIPIDGSFKMSRYHGMSILVVDFSKNAAALTKFLTDK